MERNATAARKSLAGGARRPLHESNARKKVRKDPVPGQSKRKPEIPKARTKPTRPVRGTRTAPNKSTKKKPMPSTMGAMRTESEFILVLVRGRTASLPNLGSQNITPVKPTNFHNQ